MFRVETNRAIRVPDEFESLLMDRLATYIWVDALVRRAQFAGASAFILQRGDKERGDVLVKIARLNGQAAFLTRSPMAFEDDSFDWLPIAGAWEEERAVDDIINRRRQYDSDLWIIEIEDRDGRHFLTETVNGECVV